MMIYKLKQQTQVYQKHLMVVVIQQYATVLLAILTMVIIEQKINDTVSLSFHFLSLSCLIHSEHCSLFHFVCVRVRVCV
jgi:hypothetical protein